jgi:CMP/dCMP kinase
VNKKFIIAVDGASGTGKSTICKLIAKKHDFNYIDTGAIYRSLALHAQSIGINIDDLYLAKDKEELSENDKKNQKKLEMICNKLSLRFEFIDEVHHVFLDNKDVSDDIRTPEISMLASKISAVPVVRTSLLDIQHRLVNETTKKATIVDGRDMGTVVFPNANLKIFLTASDNIRAQRRYDELKAKGLDVDFDKIFKETVQRDLQDSNRSIAPLKKADDAVEINTDQLDLKSLVNKIEGLILALNLLT